MRSHEVGITVSFFVSTHLHMPGGELTPALAVNYGDVVTLDQASISANRGVLDLLYDEEAQIKRFGKRVIAPGPWHSSYGPRIEVGSPAWDDARDRARAAALLLPADEQRIALAKVRADFGMPSSACSKTLMEYVY